MRFLMCCSSDHAPYECTIIVMNQYAKATGSVKDEVSKCGFSWRVADSIMQAIESTNSEGDANFAKG